MNSAVPTRDELVAGYLDQLQFEPYPVQEEALLAWFESDEGVRLCVSRLTMSIINFAGA